MAESVDALVSNTSGATHPGSTPGLGTKETCNYRFSFFCAYKMSWVEPKIWLYGTCTPSESVNQCRAQLTYTARRKSWQPRSGALVLILSYVK